MALTQTQLDERRKALGATDIRKLYEGGAVDVYNSKVLGEVAEELPTNDPRSIGSLLEPSVLTWAAQELGPIECGVRVAALDCPIAALLDGRLISSGEPVEVKTSGIINSDWSDANWGDEGTDEIPEGYILQCHAQLIATNTRKAHVAALIGGRGFCMFAVTLNEQLADHIRATATRFWRHVEANREPTSADWPDLRGPTLEMIKRVRREPKKTIVYPAERFALVERFEKLKAARMLMETMEEEAEAAALNELRDAEAALLPDGRTLTYLEQTSTYIDGKAIKIAMPAVHAEYTRTSRYRVARFKKAPNTKGEGSQ